MQDRDWFKKLFGLDGIEDLQARCARENIRLTQSGDFLILNYEQLESSHHSVFASFCRGLVLDGDLSVLARPFFRFFNYGENFTGQILASMGLDDSGMSDGLGINLKADGSLIKLFYHNGKWHVHTRKTQGEMPVSHNGIAYTLSFSDLAKLGLSGGRLADLSKGCDIFLFFQENRPDISELDAALQQWAADENLDKGQTHLFELCSPLNSPVVNYEDVTMYFLGSLHNGRTFSPDFRPDALTDALTKAAENNDVPRYVAAATALFEHNLAAQGQTVQTRFKSPHIKTCHTELKNIFEIQEYMADKSGTELEGFVLYWRGVPFAKLKNERYVLLHHTGSKEMSLKNLMEIVCAGEEDEVAGYFPRFRDKLSELAQARDAMLVRLKHAADEAVSGLEGCGRETGVNYNAKWEAEKRKKDAFMIIRKHIPDNMTGGVVNLLKGVPFERFRSSDKVSLLQKYLAAGDGTEN